MCGSFWDVWVMMFIYTITFVVVWVGEYSVYVWKGEKRNNYPWIEKGRKEGRGIIRSLVGMKGKE